MNEIYNDFIQTINSDDQNTVNIPRSKFQTSVCKILGISIDIIQKPVLVGKKINEHYEYLIEIAINDERWKIMRRYSKIRYLHEQMCFLFP